MVLLNGVVLLFSYLSKWTSRTSLHLFCYKDLGSIVTDEIEVGTIFFLRLTDVFKEMQNATNSNKWYSCFPFIFNFRFLTQTWSSHCLQAWMFIPVGVSRVYSLPSTHNVEGWDMEIGQDDGWIGGRMHFRQPGAYLLCLHSTPSAILSLFLLILISLALKGVRRWWWHPTPF